MAVAVGLAFTLKVVVLLVGLAEPEEAEQGLNLELDRLAQLILEAVAGEVHTIVHRLVAEQEAQA